MNRTNNCIALMKKKKLRQGDIEGLGGCFHKVGADLLRFALSRDLRTW